MPASLIVAALIEGGVIVAGGLAAAAITFGVRLVTTLVISSIIAKRAAGDIKDNAQAQLGNRIQLPPSTDNKIGVVYGSAYMKPIVVDAKISTDNKTMWYVLVFSEAMDDDSIGTFSFGDIYWGDKKLTFDQTDPTKVVSWTDSNGQSDGKAADKIHMYLYRDGSERPLNTSLKAWEVLQDASIAGENQWDNTKKMSKLVFAICKLNYDQDAGITGLAEISAVVTNTLDKPGSVIKDYLMNQRYGAGLDIARVNTTSLTALDTYSDETITYYPAVGQTPLTAPRYRINGPVDTTKNFLDNLNQICDSCDSWLSYNEKNNNWTVVINRSIYDLDPTGALVRVVDAGNIIGGINLHPMDLNQSYSSVEVQYPNTIIRDQPGYYVLDITEFPNVVRSANEPDNKLSIALPYTNNQVQAQYIAGRRLLQSREDLSITFTMDHSGIQVDAGDVVAVNHERYGWTNKLFRVNQVQESKTEDGSLFAQITASEYNDGVYDDNNLELRDFTLDLNTGITDPSLLGSPNLPFIDNAFDSAAVPSFNVNTIIPNVGTVVGVEFWYATTATISANNYSLWAIAVPSSSSIYAADDVATYTVSGLDTGNYYWRVRLIGVRNKSQFSAPTNEFVWVPNPIGTLVGQNFQSEFVPGTWTVKQDSTGTIYYSNAIPRLYGQSGGALINYSGATTDTDPRFVNNSWRIGNSSSTWYTNIISSGVVINVSSVTNYTTYAQFQQPTSINTTTGGIMTVPVRYKNNAGEIYQGIPATQRFTVVSDGIKGQDGTGTNGLNGQDGFANFVYVPIGVEPAAANNAQKTAAWVAATNRNPVYNDNGTFWGPTTHKNFSYYGTSTQWIAASVFIDGDLVSTGTIRGAALVADAIYGKSYQSNNATLDDVASPGTWINGQNGNARFAGTVNIGNNAIIGNNISIGSNAVIGDSLRVGSNLNIGQNAYIGANLTVAGLVTAGKLAVGTVTSSTLATDVRNLIAAGTGGSPSTQLGTPHVPSSVSYNSNQSDWYYSSGFVYGYWRTVGYTDNLDGQVPGSGSKTINVSFSCNLTFSGANPYPNGPLFFLYQNSSAQGGASVTLFVPGSASPLPTGANSNGSSVYPQYGSGFGSNTSYNNTFSMNSQFYLQAGTTGNILGVGFINGNGNLNNNPGSFSLTNIQWSITAA